MFFVGVNEFAVEKNLSGLRSATVCFVVKSGLRRFGFCFQQIILCYNHCINYAAHTAHSQQSNVLERNVHQVVLISLGKCCLKTFILDTYGFCFLATALHAWHARSALQLFIRLGLTIYLCLVARNAQTHGKVFTV